MQNAEGRVQNEKSSSEPEASEPQTEKDEVHFGFTSRFTDEEVNDNKDSSVFSEPSEPQTEKSDRFENDEKGKEQTEVNFSDESKEDKLRDVRGENEHLENESQAGESELGSLGSLRFTETAEKADEDKDSAKVNQKVNQENLGSLVSPLTKGGLKGGRLSPRGETTSSAPLGAGPTNSPLPRGRASSDTGNATEVDKGAYAFIEQWYTQHTLRYISPATAREIAAEVGVEFNEALGRLFATLHSQHVDGRITLADGTSVTVSPVVENEKVIGYWLREC
jgi:hypothetical protein